MSSNSNWEALFLEGNPKIINDLYLRLYEKVERYILSRGGLKKDAEDVFHNALLHLYTKAKNGELNVSNIDNYLFKVCINLWRRGFAKKRVTNVSEMPLMAEKSNLELFYDEQSQWDLYVEKFELLTENCKELLSLIFGKTPYEDIVQQFSYASQTVARQRVFKCKSRLIQLIKNDKRYKRLANNNGTK